MYIYIYIYISITIYIGGKSKIITAIFSQNLLTEGCRKA